MTQRIQWGLLGEDCFDSSQGQRSVLRKVPGSVGYLAPDCGFPSWQKVNNQEWRLSLGDPKKAINLSEWCRQLENKSFPAPAPKEPLPPELAEFDAAIAQLLEFCNLRLKSGQNLGLLTPAGVMIYVSPDDGNRKVALTDLGFCYLTDAPGKLKEWDDPVREWMEIWEEGGDPDAVIARRAPEPSVGASGQAATGVNPAREIRILGRIIASALLGRPVSHVPDPDEEPRTQKKIWTVLKRWIDGVRDNPSNAFTDIEQIRGALRANPLSEHFRPAKWGDDARGVAGFPFAAVILGILLLVAIGFGGWYLADPEGMRKLLAIPSPPATDPNKKPDPEKSDSNKQPKPGPSKVQKGPQPALGKVPEKPTLEDVKKAYMETPMGVAADSEELRAWRIEHVRNFLNGVNERLTKLIEEYRADGTTKTKIAVIEKFQKLDQERRDVSELSRAEPELKSEKQQCLESCRALAPHLRLDPPSR